MKKIKLTQGKFALVDDMDYDYLNQWKWYSKKHRNTFYAVRTPSVKENMGRNQLYLHRVILNVTDPKIFIDHEDTNGLNCQRLNLRIATTKQNQQNRRKGYGASIYKGV